MTTVADIQQGTPEWREWRRQDLRIGSSDIPVLVGLSPWKSEYELALEMTGGMPVEDEAETHDQREVGQLMEPVLLELYKRRTGRQARHIHRVLMHDDLPWATASLDAETRGERPNRLVELKHSWAVRWASKTLPEDVEVQVMWQLGVSGYRQADVMAMAFGAPRVIPLEYDPSYFEDLVKIAAAFRDRLLAGDLPKADGSDSSRRALSARFPVDNGTFLPTSIETAAIAAELAAAKRDLIAAKNRVGTAENAVRALLGEATGMGTVEADGYRITWKRTADRTMTDWKPYALELEAELSLLRGVNDPPIAEIRERHVHTEPGGRRLLAKFADAPEEETE